MNEPDTTAREEAFHDLWAEEADPALVRVDASFEAPTAPENRHIMRWLGDIRGLSILDLGTGCGESAVYFAKQGARVTATDLSLGMLYLTRSVADLHGVRLATAKLSADALPFRDSCFDVVYGANLLHHVPKERCLDEVIRVLKPRGRAAFWDPLKHNPVINVYRRMASAVRTPDEAPLGMRDLRLFRSRFARVEYRTFWLTALCVFMRFFLIERVSPAKERYWKKIIAEADRLAPHYQPLANLDERLLKLLPFLGRYCWNIVVCCSKGDTQ